VVDVDAFRLRYESAQASVYPLASAVR